ncbi:hypothetical protein C5Y96_02815 [Blastopirellula marina]|uniref:Glycosyltransferase RgtA/B/C/D-like domain-containing protein n=1 Tax=Blastopirellula marina TaxID=124 RepID=A0A2S8G319_9BACT|nr:MULTISPECIES: hypothetical protein [Pirellulaceae]PQO38818.1 hypothetical protein C5Y96_02815 [Blastopirellula marina]RCS55126.1 hypothetical protein DTL36_02820 [Bremerella cremea]
MIDESIAASDRVPPRRLVIVFLTTAVVGTLLAYAVLFVAAYNKYCGQWGGMLLPGYHFGVPERLMETGYLPNQEIGWDGQFYYLQANYLLPHSDAYSHIDAPPYRYQRIGLPIVARLFSELTGSDYVSPHTFLFASLPFVGIAMGALAAWLVAHRYSPLWCLGWAANVGIPICLLHGQPDPLADAFFILAMLALIRGMTLTYAVAASMMCLTREPYFAITGTVAAASLAGLVPWKGAAEDGGYVILLLRRLGFESLANRLMIRPDDNMADTIFDGMPNAWNYWAYRTSLWQLAVVMIPCVLFIGWQIYLRAFFGQSGSESAGGVILDFPFVAFLRTSITSPSLVMRPLYFVVMLLGFFVLWNIRRISSLSLILLPYFIVLSMMSQTVWIDLSGFAKAMGTILAFIVLALPWMTKGAARVLMVVLVASVLTYSQCLREVLGEVRLIPIPDYQILQPFSADDQPPVEDLACSIQLDQSELKRRIAAKRDANEIELGSLRLPQAYVELPIVVVNEGKTTWLRTRKNAIHLAYGWIDPSGGIEWMPPIEIPYDVAPGESFQRRANLLLLRSPGDFTLRLMMWQGSHASSSQNQADQLDIPVTIP